MQLSCKTLVVTLQRNLKEKRICHIITNIITGTTMPVVLTSIMSTTNTIIMKRKAV